MEIVEHNKTTIAALVDSPLKNKPLGDENKDFLAEAGVGSDEFLGLNSFNFGSLLNGDLLESFGSIKNVVLGVASAAVAGIAGKALANSDNEYIANAKHALSGIGALLATVGSTALDLASGTATSAIKSTGEAKSTVLGKVSDILTSAGNTKDDVVESVSDFVASAGDKKDEVVEKVSDVVKGMKDNLQK